MVANAAREANGIIDQRAFSWSGLFEQFEATLPPDVRITAVAPSVTQRDSSSWRSRSRRGVGRPRRVRRGARENGQLPRRLAPAEATNDDGLIEAVIEGTYVRAGGTAWLASVQGGTPVSARHARASAHRAAAGHRARRERARLRARSSIRSRSASPTSNSAIGPRKSSCWPRSASTRRRPAR